MGANQSAKGMGGAADPFATLAVGLNEDAKAARAKQPVIVDDDPLGVNGGVSPVTEALLDLAKARNFDGASLVDDLKRAMLEQFRNRPKDWGKMTADEQSDLVTILNDVSVEFVDKALKLFAAEDRPNVHAKVKSISADGNKTKLALEVVGESANDIADIYSVLSKDVVVILADSKTHMTRGDDADLIEPDQNAMSFEPDEDED